MIFAIATPTKNGRRELWPAAASACFIFFFATGLFAGAEAQVNDEVVVHTKSGGRFEGVLAKNEPAFVEIKTKFGPQRIARGDIARIEKGVTAETFFKKKRKGIADADGKSLLELAKWCEEQGLWQEAVATYLETMEVAGPHFAEAEMRLAGLAMRRKDYRLALECYQDLAVRLGLPEARDAMRAAEDLLMRERLGFWQRARQAHEAKRYGEAVIAYREALACATRVERAMERDVSKDDIKTALIQCRLEMLAALQQKYPTPRLVHVDKGPRAWHFFPRPENLRRMTKPISFENLRLDVEAYFGRWLAVRGVYAGASEYQGPLAAAAQIGEEKHPELAVAAYTNAARALHQEMAAGRKDELYLKDLLREGASYPYDEAAAALEGAARGSEIVCYGRLLKRNEAVPPYVFEVWAVEAVADPDAARLAECFKRSLRCDFEETPLAKALEFIEMVTQAHFAFEGGETPEVSITLSVSGLPAGAVVDKIAADLGLKWTRRGANVLFVKRDLTPDETALQRQVLRLATDTKADAAKAR